MKKAFTLAEGATHVSTPPVIHRRSWIDVISAKFCSIEPRPAKGSKAGFTLAEVLITLGIIGIVAAMTIPNLNAKLQTKQTVVKLEAAHSILSRAYKLAVYENGDVESWDIGKSDTTEGANKLMNYFLPALKTAQVCGTSKTGCFAKKYISARGQQVPWQPDTWQRYAGVKLLNGLPILFFSLGTGCTNKALCGMIRIDVNGERKPNQYGVDTFQFNITSEGIVPSGAINADENGLCDYNYNNKVAESGIHCTSWIMKNKNINYMKKYKELSKK